MELRRRQIYDADLDHVAELLSRGFGARSREYWRDGLARLRSRSSPDGFPKYGFVLERDQCIVGAVLMIYAIVPAGKRAVIRCNISSWFVEPEFRAYASLLIPCEDPGVTYLNVSPAPNTWAIVEAQGFVSVPVRRLLTFPALRSSVAGAVVLAPTAVTLEALPHPERKLLQEHVALGCFCLVVRTKHEYHPFAFAPRKVIKQILPTVQLVYCRDILEYVHFAGTIGGYILRAGIWSVVIDRSNGIPLAGLNVDKGSRYYFRGQNAPACGDLAYTERVFLSN